MKQPTPKVTEKDIKRIVLRDFPSSETEKVHEILELYGKEKYEREAYRVRAASLKISAGKIEILKKVIEGAKQDFRDVLMDAEYPECKKKVFKDLDKKEEKEIYKADWNQYMIWFKQKG